MSKYSVKKPITVLMAILIIIVLGFFSLSKLPISLFPNVELPFMVIATTYEGANPFEVEEQVTKKIESNISTISNFDSVTSTSNEHFSLVMIQFTDSVNLDTAYLDLRETLDRIDFRDGISKPSIIKFSPDMLPIMSVTINKDFGGGDDELIKNSEWVKNNVINRMRAVDGVADVSTSGLANTKIKVDLDEDKLTEINLTKTEVLEIIKNMNVDGLAGIVPDGDDIKMLYIGDKIDGIEELKNLPIKAKEGGGFYYLKDLSIPNGITLFDDSTDNYNKVNGKEAVTLYFRSQSSASIVDTSEMIIEELGKIKAEDSGVSYNVIMDQADYINMAIGSITSNLLIGAVLAIIILLIFLRDIKPTLIVGIAIPVSVIGAFVLMYFTGMTLNIISMGGLALGIGMLVDNSVVVIENIYRLLNEGKSKKEAAIEGAKQVVGAITSSTITTIAVFLPIVFIEGMVADVFMNLAYTVTFSLLASLLISLTLVPSMSAKYLKEGNIKKESKVLEAIKNFFERALRLSIRFKALTFVILFILLIGFGLLVGAKGFIMMPSTDEGVISSTISFQNKQDFKDLRTAADEISQIILNDSDLYVDILNTTVSSGGMFQTSTGGYSLELSLTLNKKRKNTTAEIALDLEKVLQEYEFKNLDVKNISVTDGSSSSMIMGSSGIKIEVTGTDIYKISQAANDLTALIEDLEYIKEVDNGINEGKDTVKLQVNKENAIKNGVTTRDVLDSVNLFYTALGSGMSSSNTEKVTIIIDGLEYEITVPTDAFSEELQVEYKTLLKNVFIFDQKMLKALNAEYEQNKQFVLYFPLSIEADKLQLIINPLLMFKEENNGVQFCQRSMTNPSSCEGYTQTVASQVKQSVYSENTNDSIVKVDYNLGFSSIYTNGKTRILNVTATLKDGYNATKVAGEIEKIVKEYKNSESFNPLKNSVSININGENEEIMDAFGDLIVAMLVAVLLVYMIMAIQFQSLKYPLIVMVTVPLAFTGGFMAMFLTNTPFSIVSIMGLIILVGIVVNNGIVLIDYTNKLLENDDNLTVVDACVQAARTRLRPILMTSLTTILALFTMALGIGEGSELLQPMAIASIGGLIYSTILTLIVIPTIYILFNKKRIKNEEARNH